MFPNIWNNDEARAFFKENGYPEQYNDGLLAYLRETYPFAGGQTLPDLLARYLKEYGDTFNMIIAGKTAIPLSFIVPAATFKATTPTNGGSGTIVLTSAGTHGLTAARAVGARIYISAGTLWTPGFYPITAIDLDTTGVAITITGTFNAGMGRPTIALVNTEVTLSTIPIPPLLGGSVIRMNLTCSSPDASAIVKRTRVKFGSTLGASTIYYNRAGTTSPQISRHLWIHNRGATNSQIAAFPESATGGDGISSATLPVSTIDTSVTSYIFITGEINTANAPLVLERYVVEVLR